MAASDLARGHTVSVDPCPKEVTYFLLAKEFGWTPSQCKKENSKDMAGLITLLNVYNKIKNAEMERLNRK